MFLNLTKNSRRVRSGKGARRRAKLKAKNRRRVNGMKNRKLGRRPAKG